VDRGAELLDRLLLSGRPVGAIEEAWERVILAERMRFNLQIAHPAPDFNPNSNSISNSTSNSNTNSKPYSNPFPIPSPSPKGMGEIYVDYINRNFNGIKRIPFVVK
jgi:hypothetical protein